NLSSTIKVGHAAAQRIPSHRSVGAGFRSAIDLEVFGLVDGRLWPQHIQAVVKLDRVLIDPVLEAHPFWTSSQVGHHFAAKLSIQLLAQKTHDLLAAQIEHPVEDQAREES